jgi:diguanylate cyclase (GGDEF)-like protein
VKPHGLFRRPGWLLVGLAAAWLAAIGGLSWLLASSEGSSRSSLVQRFDSRTALGSEFASLYVRDLISREHREGRSWLAGSTVSRGDLQRAASGLGVRAAALIDRRERLLAAAPGRTRVPGRPLVRRFTELASRVAEGAAGRGVGAVSDMIRSPAGVIVAVDAPFRDRSGRLRVLGGAYPVSQTPLSAYLDHLVITPGRRVYLLDSSGAIVAGTTHSLAGERLGGVEPRLGHAIARGEEGSFAGPGGAQQFVRIAVPRTPWQIVVAVPQAQLFASVDSSKWLAWGGIAGFALAGLAAILLVARLNRSRRRLVALNRELERLAHVDSLTELKNRRALEESIEEALSAAKRHDHELSVLLVDIDRFKALNDTHGHRTGDEVLREVARELDDARRGEDVIGRWGGEEFLLILPGTDEAGARRVAERLRTHVSNLRVDVRKARGLALTVTVGVAQWGGESSEELIDRADAALYAGKAAGRDVVCCADPRSRRAAASLVRIA